MHKYFRRMATDIFLYAANVSKVLERGRGLPCKRLTVTRYFIDMNDHTEHQCFCSTRYKLLKQKPFPMNFLLNFLHSLFTHLFSLKSAHISFLNVEPRVFWSTETTVIPKLTLGKGKRTQSSKICDEYCSYR